MSCHFGRQERAAVENVTLSPNLFLNTKKTKNLLLHDVSITDVDFYIIVDYYEFAV